MRCGFIYDDHIVIGQHEGVSSAGDVVRIFGERHFPNLPYYRPVTRATLLLQKGIHGELPAYFHLVNVLMAAATALAVYALLRMPVWGLPAAAAMLAAALFAVHPVASSCVYPVSSGRETLMPGLWTVLAVYGWLRARRWRAVSVAAFVLAIFSKEQAVVVPLLLLVADLTGVAPDRPSSAGGWLRRYAPLAAVLAGYGLIRYRLFGASELARGDWGLAAWSPVYALQAILTPTVALLYEPTRGIWLSPVRLAVAAAMLALLVVRLSRRTAAFWLAWFVLGLLPTANLLRQEAPYDERWLHLPSLAIIVCATGAAVSGLGLKRALIGCSAAVAVCGGISAHRARYFEDDFAFSGQWVRTNPGSVNAHYNLGLAFARRGEWGEAARHYGEAAAIRPDYAFAHNNLGNALGKLGERERAVAHLRRALELDPGYADAHLNLGLTLAQSGATAEAAPHFEKVLELQPDSAAAHNSLGILRMIGGDTEGGLRHFREALRLAPSAEAHNNMGNALLALGRYDEALRHYSEASRLDPALADAARNATIVRRKMAGEGGL